MSGTALATYRMAETFLSYLLLTIAEMPVIPRTTDGRPYGRIDLLRILMIYIGKVAGGAFLGGDASPTVTS